MTRVESTPFMTSSPRKNKLPPPRHPLENRNSAPDIVVTGTTGKSLKILHFQGKIGQTRVTKKDFRKNAIFENDSEILF